MGKGRREEAAADHRAADRGSKGRGRSGGAETFGDQEAVAVGYVGVALFGAMIDA